MALQWINLGKRSYQEVLVEQFRLREFRAQGRVDDTILLVEHPKIITQGRRPAEEDYLLSKAELLRQGYDIKQVNRGGKLTYHGPGQLVVYFIISLRDRGWKVPQFVHLIEEVVIQTLQRFAVSAERREGCPGVWLQEKKIASLGLSVNRGVSMHGLALNINPNLDDFKVIVSCGMPDCKITSLSLASEQSHSVTEVEAVLQDVVCSLFGESSKESATNSARSLV